MTIIQWEEPEEYAAYEHQQQKLKHQQQNPSAKPLNSPPQAHLRSQTESTQGIQLKQAHCQVQSVQ